MCSNVSIRLCKLLTTSEISAVARPVFADKFFTSPAITANPLPASPARAASIVAFRASKFVCLAIAPISSATLPTRPI
jgi:hypothetical protein